MLNLNFRSRFILKNLLKGLGILTVIIICYVLLQRYTDFEGFLEHIGQWPIMVYTSFIVSEVVFGIIPPELYMIWVVQHGVFGSYYIDILLLATISYAAGVLGYALGGYIKKTWPVFFGKYVLKYKNVLNRFGGLLILIGAITPIPFSAICMLVGSTNYPFSRFLLIALSRFIRFGVYGFTIYQFNL